MPSFTTKCWNTAAETLHLLTHHAYGDHQPDVANDFRHRARLPACLQEEEKESKPDDKDVRVDFTMDEVGDSWEEYAVFHHRFKEWMEVNGIDTSKNYSQKGTR